MKLFKHFIFFGLLTLISVFNFSSAKEITVSTLISNSLQNSYCYYPIQRGLTDGDYYLDLVSGDIGYGVEVQYNEFTPGSILPKDNEIEIRVWCKPGITLGTCPVFKIVKDVPLIPGGSAGLSGAVSKLSGTVSEFIPYIVYIGVGILTVSILFVGIKWLLNWIKSKTLSPFK